MRLIVPYYHRKLIVPYYHRKGYRAQHCLLALLEKGKCPTDRGKAFGALLADLSNAFDYLGHELLLAKLNV